LWVLNPAMISPMRPLTQLLERKHFLFADSHVILI
jgi:hypothetical protein